MWSAIVLVVVLALIVLLAPQGTLIAGCVLMGIGGVMILVRFSAGAYGAFCEDFIYGVLYLVIPLYTAYYMATRWEDLWVWLACSTAGVGLILSESRSSGGPEWLSGDEVRSRKPESPGSGLSGSVDSMRLSHTVRMTLRIMYASRCRCSAVSRA